MVGSLKRGAGDGAAVRNFFSGSGGQFNFGSSALGSGSAALFSTLIKSQLWYPTQNLESTVSNAIPEFQKFELVNCNIKLSSK
jgi:hypothetical protein